MMKDLTPEAVQEKFEKYEIDTSKYGIIAVEKFHWTAVVLLFC